MTCAHVSREHVTSRRRARYAHVPRQVFSRAGLLADPNLDPMHLSTFVRIGVNKKTFKPSVKESRCAHLARLRRVALLRLKGNHWAGPGPQPRTQRGVGRGYKLRAWLSNTAKPSESQPREQYVRGNGCGRSLRSSGGCHRAWVVAGSP